MKKRNRRGENSRGRGESILGYSSLQRKRRGEGKGIAEGNEEVQEGLRIGEGP